MKYVYPCIDQLDLSAQQLKTDNASYARFSLILTDNIIELMLHRQCEQTIRKDESFAQIREPKFDDALKRKVLGQHFDEKVKFCKKIGKISQDELDFVLICHKYRNELYHSGIKYEQILHSLAWYYHELACGLFKKLEPSYFSFSSDDNPSQAVLNHLGDEKHYSMRDDILQIASESLNNSRPSIDHKLSWYLSRSIIYVIENMIEALEFVVESAYQKTTIDEIIPDIQISDFIKNSENKESVLHQNDVINSHFDILRIVKERWKPPVNIDKINKWKDRATAIKNEKNPTKALTKFDKLKEDISHFENLAVSHAAAVDQYIQDQVDAYRGK